jgi:Amt family ammonium transporter
VCSGCDNYYVWSASIVAAVAGILYRLFSTVVEKNRIDDPLEAFAVHAGAGNSAFEAAGVERV